MSHFLTLAFIAPDVARRGSTAIVEKVNQVMTLHAVHLLGSQTTSISWDAWQIGGRYNGLVGRLTITRTDGSSAVTIMDEPLCNNACPVSALSDDLVPFAIVTPDGTCYAEGKMGSFGYSYDHDPYWEDQYDALREQYADCLAVGIDCHI